MKIGKYKVKDIINPVKWYRAFKWHFWGQYVKIKKSEILEVAEIICYRAYSCRPCADNGSCLDCGCPFGAKASILKEKCPKDLWIATDIETWKKTKETLGIEIGPLKRLDKNEA